MDITRTDRWSVVPLTLGMILLAAGAANNYELATSSRDMDWFLLLRADLQLLLGLWLLCGLRPRWVRIVVIAALVGIMAYDAWRVRALAGHAVPSWFGQVAVEPRWLLGGDLIMIIALLRWRPGGGRP